MKISKIEHLGIAVPSIEEALPYYENVLGLKCYNIETVEDQKVRTAFLKVGDVKIELLEPTSPESTIAKFIEKNNGNGGMHHLAFAVEDGVANALAEAEGTRIGLIIRDTSWVNPASFLGISNPDSLKYLPVGKEGSTFQLRTQVKFNMDLGDVIEPEEGDSTAADKAQQKWK